MKLTGFFLNHPHFIISLVVFNLLQNHFIQPKSQMPLQRLYAENNIERVREKEISHLINIGDATKMCQALC